MANLVKLSSLSFWGAAIETTFGTPIAATGFIPVTNFKPQDMPTYIADNGMRGLAVMDFGQYLGPQHSEFEIDGLAYPTSIGNLLAAIFGQETKTGSASPYTHKFQISPDGSSPSYTLNDYYVANNRQYAASRSDKLTLKFSPTAGLTYTSHWLGFASTSATKPASNTFSTDKAFLGWTAACTLGGVSRPLLSATITISREGAEAIFQASNSQTPYDILQGPMRVTWELEFAMTSDTEYNYAVSQGSQAVSVVFTDSTSNDTLTLTSTAVQFTRPTISRSGRYVTLQLTGKALNNATDAGVMSASLVNEINSSYTTTVAS